MAGLLVRTKAALSTGLARLFGMEWNQAIGSGLLLSQGGEFGFVLFAQAQNALLIAPQAASLFSAIVTFSIDRKSTRLNSSHSCASRMPSSSLFNNLFFSFFSFLLSFFFLFFFFF